MVGDQGKLKQRGGERPSNVSPVGGTGGADIQDCGAPVRTSLIKASLGWTRPALQWGMPHCPFPKGELQESKEAAFL